MTVTSKIRLAELVDMGVGELEPLWARLHGLPAPTVSPDLLRRGIAYRLQEKRQGGLDRRTSGYLMRHNDNEDVRPRSVVPSKLTIGTKLVRDWHGVGHSVTILESGYDYADKHWRSLSAIAHAITGTKWSGPRFFGLTKNAAS